MLHWSYCSVVINRVSPSALAARPGTHGKSIGPLPRAKIRDVLHFSTCYGEVENYPWEGRMFLDETAVLLYFRNRARLHHA